MAITVYKHRVNGSSASTGQALDRFVEMAFVDGIPGDSPSAVKALALSAPGIPKKGEPHETYPRATLVQADADPVGPSQCWVRLTYETATGTLSNGLWVVNDSSILQQQTTELFPDTWQRIRVVWVDPVTKARVDNTASINFARPTRALTAEGEYRGRVPETWFDCIGKVNSGVFRSKPKGYWLCSGVETRTSNQGSSYAVKVTFLSRVHIDWSEYGLCVNPMSGKFVPVLDTDAADLRNQPYSYTMKVNVGGGITKVGPYKEAPFPQIFRNIPF